MLNLAFKRSRLKETLLDRIPQSWGKIFDKLKLILQLLN
jgi:hypothetical protein